MILHDKMASAINTIIKSPAGHMVKHVKSFDTETFEAEMYARIELIEKHEGQPDVKRNIQAKTDLQFSFVTFKCYLKGYKAYNRKTGEEIK